MLLSEYIEGLEDASRVLTTLEQELRADGAEFRNKALLRRVSAAHVEVSEVQALLLRRHFGQGDKQVARS